MKKIDSLTNKTHQRFENAQRFVANYLNSKVNKLSVSHRKVSLIMFGLLIGAILFSQVIQCVVGEKNETQLNVEKITMPNDLYMKTPDTQKLTPIGKMKGEIGGEFDAFHVAIDHEGQLYINRNPEFTTDSLDISKGWKQITHQELDDYKKKLHFIPYRKMGLKR
jgi:hypothetical protein